MKNILADLREKLELCYERRSKESSCNNTVEKMEIETDSVETTKTHKLNTDISLKLPETPTDDPLNGDSDEFISCNQLYTLVLKADSRYLIIDTREKEHFDTSRILSNKCINIPQSDIKIG